MLLAFRKEVPSESSVLDAAGAAIIKARLVSDFYHGGVVVNNLLFHSTAREGLHCVPFNPDGWIIFDAGTGRDFQALDLFLTHEKADYDWFSLLAFIVPWRMSDAKRWYCFEWQWYCLTGEIPTFRVRPEKILLRLLEEVNLGK